MLASFDLTCVSYPSGDSFTCNIRTLYYVYTKYTKLSEPSSRPKHGHLHVTGSSLWKTRLQY
jgi:hypothetical protein